MWIGLVCGYSAQAKDIRSGNVMMDGRHRTVGEVLVGLLEAHGVDTVFGIPGVHTLELYRGLAHTRIQHVTPRHEEGAAFMADGYARVTGKPGVCVLITGPGVTNAATGIAQAYHDSQPMLVISSTTNTGDRGRGLGVLHDLPDQSGLTSTITAFSETVVDAEQLPHLLQRAYTLFASARPRPVHLSIPTDVLERPAPDLHPLLSVPGPPEPDARMVAAAADMLAEARRPIVVLGGGAIDAGVEATDVADLIGAPIVLTGNAKGTVPADHPLSLGCSLPTEIVLSELRHADLVLAVGTELSSVELINVGGEFILNGRLIRIDIDPAQLQKRFDAAVGLHADARLALAALRAQLAARRDPALRDGASRAHAIREGIAWWPQIEQHRRWLDAIARSLPNDAVVALDSTQLAYSMHQALPWSHRRSWLAPYGYGTLGPALPMAIGAKVASRTSHVVAVAGDGGALFTIAELAASVQHKAPVTLLIWNSRSYAEIADAMDEASVPRLGTDLTAVDFALLARSLGCRGERVTSSDELGETLSHVLSCGTTTVIDIQAQE